MAFDIWVSCASVKLRRRGITVSPADVQICGRHRTQLGNTNGRKAEWDSVRQDNTGNVRRAE